MGYILDTNVLFRFEHADALSLVCELSTRMQIVLAQEVYNEATVIREADSDARKQKKRSARRAIDASLVAVRDLAIGTPPADLFLALRAGKTSTKDSGEAQSIAIAAEDAGLVFVSADTIALFSALNELADRGERVITAYVFLRRMFTAGYLATADIHACAPQFAKYPNRPSWWASWLADLRP